MSCVIGLYVIYYVLIFITYYLHIMCYLPYVTHRISYILYWIFCDMSCIVYCIRYIIYHILYMNYTRYDTSYFICYVFILCITTYIVYIYCTHIYSLDLHQQFLASKPERYKDTSPGSLQHVASSRRMKSVFCLRDRLS